MHGRLWPTPWSRNVSVPQATHSLWPAAGWRHPDGQRSHVTCIWPSLAPAAFVPNLPAAQKAVQLLWPRWVWYVPAGQSVHAVERPTCALYLPVAHAVHDAAASWVLCVPAAQGTHSL